MAQNYTLDKVKGLVSSVDLLIYAPPAYGKTVYMTNRRKQLDLSVHDTDDLDCPPGSDLEVLVTNYHQLISDLPSQLVIAFVPSEEQMKAGCEFRGLNYKHSWYTDVLDSLQKAGSSKDIILINSGAPIIFYERFIHSCVMAIWDCGPLPKVPSPPKEPPKEITQTKTQVVTDEDTLDPKVVQIIEPIKPGSQIMYRDDALEQDTNAIHSETKSCEQPGPSPSTSIPGPLEPITNDLSMVLQPLPTCSPKHTRLRRTSSEKDTRGSKHRVKSASTPTPPPTDKQRRYVARIFHQLCSLQLPPFRWDVKEDYEVCRGSVKFKSFGNFITCTDGTYQFHCSRHLFLKWSH